MKIAIAFYTVCAVMMAGWMYDHNRVKCISSVPLEYAAVSVMWPFFSILALSDTIKSKCERP